MPALSAHDQFGKQVYKQLSKDLRFAAKQDIRLFRLGFQGPDVLFYYRPLKANPIAKLGMELHVQSGKTLFSRLCEQQRRHPSDSLLSYMLGLCCHYALDRVCHPYVNAWADGDGRAHQWLESNFDFLIRKEFRRTERRYLNLPKSVNVETLVTAYSIDKKQALEAIRSFRMFESVLDLQRPMKIAERMMNKQGKFSSLSLPQENHLPIETEHLFTLFCEAVPLGVRLVDAVYQAAGNEDAPLLDFEENFEGVREA